MKTHNWSSDPLVRFGVLFCLVGWPIALLGSRGEQQASISETQGFHWVDPTGRGSIRLGFTDNGPELALVAPEGESELTLGFRNDENGRSQNDVAAFVRATSQGSDGERSSGELLVTRARGMLVLSQYGEGDTSGGAALLGVAKNEHESESSQADGASSPVTSNLLLWMATPEHESALRAMSTPETVTVVGDLDEIPRVGLSASGPVSAQVGILPVPEVWAPHEAPHAYFETNEAGTALELGSKAASKRVTAND